jgi:HAD superfamily hydrolase (TIGR01490 family)
MAVIFDVDRTIVKTSTGKQFALLAIQEGVFPKRALLHIPLYFLYYKIGRMNVSFFTKRFPLIAGKTRQELETLAQTCFHTRLKPRLYPQAMQIISAAKREGESVLLATSSIDIVIRPIAEYLDVEYMATRMEFNNGVSTGRFIPPPLFGEEKCNQVLAYLEKHAIDPHTCSFYSDSVHDVKLLQAVGTPVAVNPDNKLKRIAKRRNWNIVYFQ